MSFSYRRYDQLGLGIGHAAAHLEPEHLIHGVDAAFRNGVLAPGNDRVITFAPNVLLQTIDLSAMRAIQRVELSWEGHERCPRFRTIWVAQTRTQWIVASMFKALWDGLDEPGIAVRVEPSMRAAFRRLGYATTLH